MKESDELINLGFILIGEWMIEYGNLKYQKKQKIKKSDFIKYIGIKNAAYAFITSEINHDELIYIGKTSNSIGKRFAGYCKPDKSQRTNINCNAKILEKLKANKQVEIYAFFGPSQLSWGGLQINMPAALEDALIEKIKPELNKTGKSEYKTETQSNEESVNNK
jgi:hypothetical protein